MNKLVALTLAITCAFFSGCAFSRSESKVNYLPSIGSAKLEREAAKSVELGEVKDARGLQDPTTIFQKKNLNGDTTSGTYAADRPIATILREGLSAGLVQKGFTLSKGGHSLRLEASIQDFSYDVVMGFWKGTIKPKMMVRIEVFDVASGKSVWKDSIVGRANVNSGDYIVQSVTQVIDDVVTQLLNDKSFREIVL
jgi:uncharacterized lipoprotein YajG